LQAHPSRALLVDPNPTIVSQLAEVAASAGYECTTALEFHDGRRALATKRPDILVANLRLAAFNGIHLAYLAKNNRPKTHVLIYGKDDPALAREAQQAGAFYEQLEFVLYALAAFLRAALPARDRRSVAAIDRRAAFRGGRRATDIPMLHAAASV
jgi:DNA-binding NtrC family response regulator